MGNKRLTCYFYEQFIQRGKVLSLWRTIVRGCHKIPDVRTRQETLGFAREEFKRNKGVEDLVCLIHARLFNLRACKLIGGITDTDSIPHINGQDAVAEYGEVYSGPIITSVVPTIDRYSVYI